METPKFTLTLANPSEETGLIYDMLFNSGQFWKDHLIKNYPQFASFELSENINLEIEKEIIKLYKEKFEVIFDRIKTRNIIIQEKFQSLFLELNKIFNLNKFEDLKVFLTVVPLGSRYIKENRIGIQYWIRKEEFMQIFAHEYVHLLWFNKLLEVFPNIDFNQFDNDKSKEWAISEIICIAILHDEKIKLVIGESPFKAYNFNIELIKKFQIEYNKFISENLDFKTFYETLEEIFAKEVKTN